MDERKLLEKRFRDRKRIIIPIILLIVFIISFFNAKVFSARSAPEPIPNYKIEKSEEYCFVSSQLITDCLAYSDEDKYYAICDTNGIWCVVIMNDSLFNNSFSQLNAYTYNKDENADIPQAVTIKGISEKTPEDVKKFVMEYFGIESEAEYKNYFGEYLINTKRTYVSAAESISIVICTLSGILLLIVAIYFLSRKFQLRKCLNRIAQIGEIQKAYNEICTLDCNDKSFGKVQFSPDYYINFATGIIIKYTDIIWIFKRIQRYNFITVGASIIAQTPFGQFSIARSKNDKNKKDIGTEIAEEIQRRVPEVLIGYTIENELLAKQRITNL